MFILGKRPFHEVLRQKRCREIEKEGGSEAPGDLQVVLLPLHGHPATGPTGPMQRRARQPSASTRLGAHLLSSYSTYLKP